VHTGCTLALLCCIYFVLVHGPWVRLAVDPAATKLCVHGFAATLTWFVRHARSGLRRLQAQHAPFVHRVWLRWRLPVLRSRHTPPPPCRWHRLLDTPFPHQPHTPHLSSLPTPAPRCPLPPPPPASAYNPTGPHALPPRATRPQPPALSQWLALPGTDGIAVTWTSDDPAYTLVLTVRYRPAHARAGSAWLFSPAALC